MNKRDFLKTSGGGLVAIGLAGPARAAIRRRIAIVQPGLPGAAAFAARERAAGAELMTPEGDPVRWYRTTLRPALGRAEIAALTDATHTLILDGSLREAGYVRFGRAIASDGATQWGAVRRS